MLTCEDEMEATVSLAESPSKADHLHRDELNEQRPAAWKMMASAAVVTVFGMPCVSTGSFRAAWVEVSQWIAALQK